jgi:TusA-related sulfurtransferase
LTNYFIIKKEIKMAEILDYKGLRCPQPVLKFSVKANSLPVGTNVEIHADCHSFPDDISKWCNDNGKVLVSVVDQEWGHVATVQL